MNAGNHGQCRTGNRRIGIRRIWTGGCTSNLFLARLLAYGVAVVDGGGGCGRDIFRFLYLARDKPDDKQNAATAPIRRCGVRFQPQNREFGKTVAPTTPMAIKAKGERKTHTIMRRFEFESVSLGNAMAVRID